MADAPLKPRDAVIRMAPYSPPTGGRLDKLRMDFNENTVGCSPRIALFLRDNITQALMSVYPDYTGVREALAPHFGVDPAQILLTNGTDEAIQVIVNTYVDDNDEVLLMRPSYAMYRFYSEVAGANVKEIDYRAPDFTLPVEELLDAITPRTRAILIANPNNPTGTGIGLDAIECILARAPQAAVLIDEAYYEFSGVTAIAMLSRYRNLFVSRTFSKVYGMAAMRMGCVFSQEANIAFLHKAQSPYSVNTLAAMAAAEAVKDTEYINRYVTEALAARDLLCKGLERLGIPYTPSSANFVLGHFGRRAIEIRDALRGRAILVRDRSYEIPGGVRITVGTCEQTERVVNELDRIW
ncbi:MAG TPA: histidinol-phosphate transaminase [Bryobacteraceae bacterium]